MGDLKVLRAARLLWKILGRGRQIIEPLLWGLILFLDQGSADKTISAMMRVRDEEEFLEAAVLSILNFVDEIVIVDNLSSDGTPGVIAQLLAAYPNKIKAFTYSHELARYGQENTSLAATRGGMNSPSLLKNFYNYCLSLCKGSHVLKWDGDTIATEALGAALEKFRAGPAQVLWHTGANVHENRKNLIGGRPFEDMEPRLFRRKFAKYDNKLGYCETLSSPYLAKYAKKYADRCLESLYVHMKFCKANRFSNLSDDLKQLEIENSRVGQPAPREIIDALERWTSGSVAPSRAAAARRNRAPAADKPALH